MCPRVKARSDSNDCTARLKHLPALHSTTTDSGAPLSCHTTGPSAVYPLRLYHDRAWGARRRMFRIHVLDISVQRSGHTDLKVGT